MATVRFTTGVVDVLVRGGPDGPAIITNPTGGSALGPGGPTGFTKTNK